MSQRRDAAMRELLQVEAQRALRYGARPAEGLTLETAQAAIREANRANPDKRRPIAADYDVSWFSAKSRVDEVEAELSRLDERQAELSQRLGALRRLRQAVEQHAAANSIALPGVDFTQLRSSAGGLFVQVSGAAPAPAPAAGTAAAARGGR